VDILVVVVGEVVTVVIVVLFRGVYINTGISRIF